MSKKALLILISIVSLAGVTSYSNEYFEDKIFNQNKKILGISKEERFFLPFPKEYQLISTNSDQRNSNIIISTKKPAKEIAEYYKEILRSKEFENDYEFEKDNVIELRYFKDSEDLKIAVTQEGNETIVEFNYHN